MEKTLSIIIPVYNEEQTLNTILEKVFSVQLISNIKREVVIVNDASTDQSETIIQDYMKKNLENNIQYYAQPKNMGKGAAIHTGIDKSKGDFLIIQDADLEYDPYDYNDLLAPVINGFADVVYGSRFIGGKPHRTLFFLHTIGNKLLTFTSNLFTNINITDMETCYKLFKADIIKKVHLKEKRFGFEPEVTAKIARIENIRIYEVGISYYGRTYQEGKKINWKDGVRAIYCILKYNLFSRQVYK